ncbi:MAG: hypothetical protein ACK501_09335 [Planctomycetota bacterium]|jgi:hypothetical protein
MPFAYDPPRMPSSTSPRSTRVLATILLCVATACGEQAAHETAPPDEAPSRIAQAEARRSGRELLLTIRLEHRIRFTHEDTRREAIARVVGSGAELGVVPLEIEFVEAESSPHSLPAPDWLQAMCPPVPLLDSRNDGPLQVRFHLMLLRDVFADADFRPIDSWDDERLVAPETARTAIEEARAKRRGRDAEFVIADFLDGRERAAALHRGLAFLDRWIVVRGYAAELEELVESGDETVRSWAEPLLRESRTLRAYGELHRAQGDSETISPRRLSEQLANVVRRYADLPEVDMLAACIQGDAEWRLALDDASVNRICKRVAVAAARCSASGREFANGWLAAHGR